MEHSLLDKLVGEVQRYQNKEFLKAVLSVCALTAYADGKVTIEERYRIDSALQSVPALQVFDTSKMVEILDDYIFSLQSDGIETKKILENKISRFANDKKKGAHYFASSLSYYRCR